MQDRLDRPGSSQDRRPRPRAILPKLARPFSAKRARHVRTEFALTPTRRPISLLATPSAASSRAWPAGRCGAGPEVDRAKRSRTTRSSSLRGKAAAGASIVNMLPASYRSYLNDG